ncbi:MAG TPA: radical SAM protein [Methanomassiliicoccaceae archaeon]|jgi:7-carboxy-7-deazaguanine synthase|nr:radical SAM protein [Euryarchaeota archaeon]HOB38814.1 radical SAM protein [Methanomassiliicoccaceae archaeon]HOK27883.1 radical SAM protein [Methanomassiliicoccaceae archaeon]HOL07527.1 radical SAM protein [Methanomassiliicoccaceae archaeon]HOQ25184.1 radical SAM protein [Methanomassiliicoccaceae archaeon]
MKVIEIFTSLQGEGVLMGTPTTFVRFEGCNLDCQWCDTKYAREGGREMTPHQVLDEVEERNVPFVCLTGGEPMLQEGILEVIEELLDSDHHVTIETNGSVPLDPLPTSDDILISMDVKCPSSGMSHRLYRDNLTFLGPQDQLKFIIADRVDYLYAKKVLRENEVNCPIIMTPVGGTELRDLATWVLEDRLWVRVLPQLHKLIWGEKRGV